MQITIQTSEQVMNAAPRLKAELAAKGVIAAGHRLRARLAKANFNRNQPRVPAGVREGGQWVD